MRLAIYESRPFGQVIEHFYSVSENLSIAGWLGKRYELYCQHGLLVKPGASAASTDFDVMAAAILDERLVGHPRKKN